MAPFILLETTKLGEKVSTQKSPPPRNSVNYTYLLIVSFNGITIIKVQLNWLDGSDTHMLDEENLQKQEYQFR